MAPDFREDKSLSRYPEFAAYKQRTGILLPALNSTAASALRTRFDCDGVTLEQNHVIQLGKFENWIAFLEVPVQRCAHERHVIVEIEGIGKE